MRVLWICNIMLPAVAEHLGLQGSPKEGWVAGLCDTVLARQAENEIELHVAFPVSGELDGCSGQIERNARFYYHGFYEDMLHAEKGDPQLKKRLAEILNRVQPHVVHCFGTEYEHTLAALQSGYDRGRILVGVQGICAHIARYYMADLPRKVQCSATFRDAVKRDSLRRQQRNYIRRGMREQEIIRLAYNVTGRTEFDRKYVGQLNKNARYFKMNETLRPCFYEGKWSRESCVPHRIFVSQADYPLKGLHYLLLAAGRLQQRYPDLEIHVAGNSLVNYRTVKDKIKISAYGKYLRQLIMEQKLEGRIAFLGKRTAEEMREEYLHCGLFLCCSVSENSPNSLGEAMMLGVPCAAARTGGIPSIFEDGKDGLMYQMENNNGSSENGECLQKTANALECVICQIWEHSAETDEFCRNARKHAEKTHDKEANYQQMTEIYAKIAGEK